MSQYSDDSQIAEETYSECVKHIEREAKLPLLKPGQTFRMAKNPTLEGECPICTITAIDSFGSTSHYGFTYLDLQNNYQAGWMPVFFIDAFCMFGI